MPKSLAIALVVLASIVALASIAAGCGGDGSETSSAAGDSTASAASSTSNAPRPAKAAFIKEADAICTLTDQVQGEALKAFEDNDPKATADKKGQEEAVLIAGMPPVQVEAEKLAKLSPPAADEQKVGEIVEGILQAVEEVEANPGIILVQGSSGPFVEVAKQAREYGFEACGEPF